MANIPPFRADHAGSFLRPRRLAEARELFFADDLPAVELRAIEDECIRELVAKQEQVGLKGIKGSLDLGIGSTGLIDRCDAAFYVHTGFKGSKNFVRSPEHTIEKTELLTEKLEDSLVGLVAAVEEVDDDNIVLLAVPVTPANALFDPLGIPGQVEVHNKRAKLQVDSFGGGFRGDQDCSLVAEMLHDGRLYVNCS